MSPEERASILAAMSHAEREAALAAMSARDRGATIACFPYEMRIMYSRQIRDPNDLRFSRTYLADGLVATAVRKRGLRADEAVDHAVELATIHARVKTLQGTCRPTSMAAPDAGRQVPNRPLLELQPERKEGNLRALASSRRIGMKSATPNLVASWGL